MLTSFLQRAFVQHLLSLDLAGVLWYSRGGWIKEYLLNLDFVEVARGSSPDFNAQANADAGKGKLSREGNLQPYFLEGGEELQS